MPRPALGALLILLPVTLGLRFLAPGERIPDTGRLSVDAAAMLASQDWSVRQRKHHLVGPLIEGARGDCRILVHFAPPEGASDNKFRILAKAVGPVSYHYRGGISHALPRLVPMLDGHLQRYAWSVGLAIPTAPLIAIARSPSCGVTSPDFTALRQHLQHAFPTG